MTRFPLHAPDERPALQAGGIRLWLCEAEEGHPRLMARALVEDLLAFYLGHPVGHGAVRWPRWQRPEVVSGRAGLPFSVSVSYAGRLALVGLAAGLHLGVDILHIVAAPDALQVARHYLGPEVERKLRTASADLRDGIFARSWAEMEARRKCRGLGLEEWSGDEAAAWPDSPSVRSWCEGGDLPFVIAVAWMDCIG